MPVRKRKGPALRKTDKSVEKRERLAAALKENLQKRKMRQRAMADGAGKPSQGGDMAAPDAETGLSPGRRPR
jgi:hypothetical protein